MYVYVYDLEADASTLLIIMHTKASSSSSSFLCLGFIHFFGFLRLQLSINTTLSYVVVVLDKKNTFQIPSLPVIMVF